MHSGCGEGNGNPLQYSCLQKSHGQREAGRLQSMGSLRVGYNWATSLSLFTFMHWRRKWQPTPVFLPGESQGWGTLVWAAAVYGAAQSRTRLKRHSSRSSSSSSIAVDAVRVIWEIRKIKDSITGWGSRRDVTSYPFYLRHDKGLSPRKPFLRSV